MIKLSRLADYAVVLLSQMAGNAKGVHNAVDLADRTGLPIPTVSKVLATLARNSVVRSVRGAKGGYRLASEPGNISVASIISAIDGPIALTQCVDHGADSCTVETLCPSRAGWHKINEAVERALAGVSLAELMGTPPILTDLPQANARSVGPSKDFAAR